MEFAEHLDIDLDDVESYPPSVFEFYLEKKAYDAQIKRKDENINKVEDKFHKFAEKRLQNLAQRRKNRGLAVKGGHAEKIQKQEKKAKKAKSKSEESATVHAETKNWDKHMFRILINHIYMYVYVYAFL